MADRIVIVGNGPAGLTAAETIRALNPTADIVVVNGDTHGFYSKPGLAYLLAGLVPQPRLFSRSEKDMADAQIRVVPGRAVRVSPADHRVVLAGDTTLPYDCLLLALGATAVRPDIPGISLPGVVTLDSLDDARLILNLAEGATTACVVGGGITALELAEGIASRGVETHYLMRGERYWASVLDPHESAMVEARLAHEGVNVHRGVELESVVAANGRVAAVVTRTGHRLPCDLLAVAIGIEPRIDIAREAGLATGRGIWTDAMLRTSDKDIFAAGDVAEVLDPTGARRSLDSLWSVAIAHGHIAGANMCGGSEVYRRPAPFNVTKIGGIMTTLIGAVGTGGREGDLVTLARGDSSLWRERLDGFAVAADTGDNHLRLVLSEDRILGAVVMGDQALSRPLQHAIREGLDISAVRGRLKEHPAAVAQVLAELTEPKVTVAAP